MLVDRVMQAVNFNRLALVSLCCLTVPAALFPVVSSEETSLNSHINHYAERSLWSRCFLPCL